MNTVPRLHTCGLTAGYMKHSCCLQSEQCCLFLSCLLLVVLITMLFLFVLLVVGCAYRSKGVVPASLQFVAIVMAAFKETTPCFEAPQH
jgi:hypothetical protein